MDHKKSPMRRTKRQAKVLEDNYWDCSVCTYRNNAEAFKCLMCDVRKGTSTRKPRINQALAAAQQQAGTTTAAAAGAAGGVANAAPGKEQASGGSVTKRSHHHHHKHRHHSQRGGSATAGSQQRRVHSASHPPRLKNVDRSSAQTREVTVNSVTVVITEYKPIAVTQLQNSAASAATASSESSDRGSLSESSDARS